MKRLIAITVAVVLVISFSLIPAAPVMADPGPELVALWHFDGNANDSSGNSNDGTVYGATYVSGKFGQALSFDGNDYVEVPDSSALEPSSITVEAWVKRDGSPGSYRYIVAKHYTSGYASYGLYTGPSGGLYFYVSDGSYALSNDAGTGVWDNNWHHVAGTYDGSYLRLYVDGSEVGTGKVVSKTIGYDDGKLYIGSYGAGYCFTGIIDEVRVWDEAVKPGPVTVPLCAGQNINVGTVTVWNDSTDLYVKYETTGGWEMTETHLAVVDDDGDFPTTKTGNPKVGHFPASMDHAPAVTMYTYSMPLPSGTPLYIATHAEVQKLGDVMTASLVTGAETDNVLVISENSTDPGYPLGYPESYSGTQTPSVVIQDTPNWHSGWPTITGAQWISDSLAEPPNVNEWRLFTRNFSLPSNATNISGMLHIDSDNAEAAKVNGNPAAGLVYGEVYGAFIDDGEWGRVQHWPVGSHLQPGDNTLEVMVRNYYWLNMPGDWRNYTGLVYKIDYEYQLLTTETAWGDGCEGTRFVDRGNWATYFEYHVQ